MECKILGLDEIGKVKATWTNDIYIDTRGISYVIKDQLDNLFWEPYREGDFNFISPFPKGYNPSIGENFLLPEKNSRSCYKGIYTKCYKIIDSYLITSPYDAIKVLIVKEIKI